MRCPSCNADDDRVVDSRSTENGGSIRRRRECLACKRRFTTYERIEDRVRLTVIKRDGTRTPYDRSKIAEGVRQAAYKRKFSSERVEQVVDEVEEYLLSHFEREVSSQTVGERVCEALRRVDHVAYVRYASVYRDFEDVGEFIDEARNVIEQSAADIPGQKSLFEAPEAGKGESK